MSSERVICEYCNITLVNSKYFFKHANSKHLQNIIKDWVQCDVCESYYPTPDILKNHKNALHNKALKKASNGERVACQYCSKTFSRAEEFYKHCNKEHLKELPGKWFDCPVCKCWYPTEHVLKKHKDQAHSDKSDLSQRVVCAFCPNSFCNFQKYYKHANNHHITILQQEWFSCITCYTYLPTYEALRKHNTGAHTEKKVVTERVPCHFCSETFHKPQTYHQHANDKHLDLISLDWLPCTECEYYFPNKSSLQVHLRDAHTLRTYKATSERVQCKFCPKTYCDYREVGRHANAEHLDIISQDWFQCEECGYYLPSSPSLGRHRIWAHRRKSPTKNSPVKRELIYQDEEEDESPKRSLTITSVSKAFPILQNLIKSNSLNEEDETNERSKSPIQNIDLNDFLSLEMRAESGDEDGIEDDDSPSKRKRKPEADVAKQESKFSKKKVKGNSEYPEMLLANLEVQLQEEDSDPDNNDTEKF